MRAATALRLAGPVIRRFPGAARSVASAAGWLAWRLAPDRRRAVIRNLLPVLDGERHAARKAASRVFRNVALYYIEVASFPTLDLATFEARALAVVHPERIALLQAPGPLIIVSAHTGNVELAIQALVGLDRPFVAIVEPLVDRGLAQEMLRLRRVAGGTFVEGTPAGLLTAMRALRRGGLLGLMGDRDLKGDGVCVEIFGRHARLPRGPWEIARRTGTAAMPAFCQRLPRGRMEVVLEEPFHVAVTADAEADICEAAGRWAKLFERHVRSDPSQWAVLEDFWAVHGCDGPDARDKLTGKPHAEDRPAANATPERP